jgi:U3 small nucleolar RNA-associated protein 13
VRATALAHTKEVNALALAPTGDLVLSGSQDRTLKVWALEEGGQMRELATLKGHRRAVWSAAFSPIDKVAASGSGDMMVKVWSMSDFSCLRTFEGHTASVLKLRFVSSGTQIISSGGDGLIKLWSLKSAECACTLDGHDDKVWALDTLEAEGGGVELLSGSADSLIVRWRDCTREEKAGTAEAQEQQLQLEQQLALALAAQQCSAALEAALKLGQPRALRRVVESLPATADGEAQLLAAVSALDPEKLIHCLQCARDWNTTGTHALTAQRLLHALLRSKPVGELAKLPKAKPLFEALIPYSERHFERLERLLVGSKFISYTLAAMRMLTPEPSLEPVLEEAIPSGGLAGLGGLRALAECSPAAVANGERNLEGRRGGDDLDDFDDGEPGANMTGAESDEDDLEDAEGGDGDDDEGGAIGMSPAERNMPTTRKQAKSLKTETPRPGARGIPKPAATKARGKKKPASRRK